jgi:hypothetical protein
MMRRALIFGVVCAMLPSVMSAQTLFDDQQAAFVAHDSWPQRLQYTAPNGFDASGIVGAVLDRAIIAAAGYTYAAEGGYALLTDTARGLAMLVDDTMLALDTSAHARDLMSASAAAAFTSAPASETSIAPGPSPCVDAQDFASYTLCLLTTTRLSI